MDRTSKNFFSLLEYDPLKLLNKHAKLSSLLEIRDGKRTFDPLWPLSVELHLTDLCNLNCYWCTDKDLKRNKASQNLDIIKKLFIEFRQHDVGVTLEGGGEPTKYKNFAEVVRYAGEIGLDLGLITNGIKDISDLVHYFKWIRVSVDATNSEEYKKEKGRDCFKEVLRNLERLNSARKTSETLLGIGYVLTKNNSSRVLEFIEKLDKIGIDYIYLRPVEEFNESMPDFEKLYDLHRYLIKNSYKYRIKTLLKIDERIIKNNDNLPCIAHSLTCVIRANGEVVMCEKRKHDIKIFGNISERSFKDIWLSENRKDISRAMLSRELNRGCEVCRLTKFNAILHDLGKLRTINFI